MRASILIETSNGRKQFSLWANKSFCDGFALPWLRNPFFDLPHKFESISITERLIIQFERLPREFLMGRCQTAEISNMLDHDGIVSNGEASVSNVSHVSKVNGKRRIRTA